METRSDRGACRRSLKRQGSRNEDRCVDGGSQIDVRCKVRWRVRGGSFGLSSEDTDLSRGVTNAISIAYEQF